MKVPVARVFSTLNEEGAIQFGEQAIFVSTAVEKSDGRPLSAYTASFSRGERADLPAPYDEVWVVLRGRIRVGEGNHAVEAGAGDYVHVPQNTPGELLAVEKTKMVCVAAPAH